MSDHERVVLREMDGKIALITINRPKALNALSTEVITQLGEEIDGAERDGAGAIIVTGAGEKAFIAGADIKGFDDVPRTQLPEFAKFGQRNFGKLAEFPGLTIAAVNGFCLGGGCEVAMCCDLIIAAENAMFGQPEVNLGLIPGYGGTQRLTRRIGMQRTLELCLTARMVKADEAVRIGLALEKVAAGEAVNRAREICNLALSKGPVAVKLAKRAVHHGAELDLQRGLELEADLFGMSFHTEDAVEGVAAFIGKRKAEFKGR